MCPGLRVCFLSALSDNDVDRHTAVNPSCLTTISQPRLETYNLYYYYDDYYYYYYYYY